MSPKEDEEPMEKVLVRVYSSDIEWAREFYGTLGYNRLLRLLLRKHRTTVERRRASKEKDVTTDVPEDILNGG